MKVDCVFIVAGGKGTRANCNGKQFIKINNKPILHYVIKSALALDVSKILISIGDFNLNDKEVQESLEEFNDPRIVVRRDPGVKIEDLTEYHKKELTFPFYYLYGHSPQDPRYLEKLAKLIEDKNSIIMSSYISTSQSNPKVGKILNNSTYIFRREDKNYLLDENEFFLSAPYIFFSTEKSYNTLIEKGVKIKSIPNQFHPEFNESSEIINVKKDIRILNEIIS
jgi:GTP:adenosylcobinamide-phosphate guanylyltransferase